MLNFEYMIYGFYKHLINAVVFWEIEVSFIKILLPVFPANAGNVVHSNAISIIKRFS